MDKKPNKIHVNLIPIKINYHAYSIVLTLTQQLAHLIIGQPS